MNKIAILPLKEMPSSCSECELKGSCIYWKELIKSPFTKDNKHPNCPLISIDIDELEDDLENLGLINDWDNDPIMYRDSFKTIKSTIDKLGGKQ